MEITIVKTAVGSEARDDSPYEENYSHHLDEETRREHWFALSALPSIKNNMGSNAINKQYENIIEQKATVNDRFVT